MDLNALLDLDVVAIEGEETVSVLVELTAPEAEAKTERRPSALQVVLDRSGSMAGERLEAAKRGLVTLVDRLSPADSFGLVVFDDQVHVAVPAGPLHDKAAVRALIESIPAGSMTNLSGGLMRGVREARRVKGDGGATLVLLSDGHANVGVTDNAALEQVAASARTAGVTISTVGIGLGYDEQLMAAVASGGAGNTHFAEEADAAGVALAAEVDGLLEQVAQAAVLTVRPGDQVGSIGVFNDLPVAEIEGGFMVELGDFHSGETRKLLLRIEVPAMATLGLAQVCSLELAWVEVATLATQTVTIPVNVNVVPGDEAAGRVANPVVSTELAFQEAQRAKKLATDALRAGRVDAASALYASAGDALAACPAAPEMADELREEAALMHELAERSRHDVSARVAKLSEADRHMKSRRRGR